VWSGIFFLKSGEFLPLQEHDGCHISGIQTAGDYLTGSFFYPCKIFLDNFNLSVIKEGFNFLFNKIKQKRRAGKAASLFETVSSGNVTVPYHK